MEKSTFDLVFARVKTRGRRRLDFNQFMISLDMIGDKLGLPMEDVVKGICQISPAQRLDETMARKQGPSRFFYDTSTWTGTAAHSEKPSQESPSVHRVLDLSEIVNREKGTAWTVSSPRRSGRAKSAPRPTLVSGELTPVQVRGPARFFYDRATYTGIHRRQTGGDSNRLSEATSREETKRFVHAVGSEANTAPVTPFVRGVNVDRPNLNQKFLNEVLQMKPVDSYFDSFLSPYTN